MQELAGKFVAVADEVGRLQRGQDAECRYFQQFAEKGHYAGRKTPSDTRQGIYAVTATGEFLGSINTREGRRVASMLREALARFAALSPAQRSGDKPPFEMDGIVRFEQHYPADGLVLHAFTRDLPRDKTVRGWRSKAWNQDYAWFRRAEMMGCMPEARVGAEREMPKALLHRVVRCHLLDTVRGQTSPHREGDIERARLVLRVTAIEDGALVLRLEGEVKVERRGDWAVAGFSKPQSAQSLGYDARLLGSARFDTKAERCTSFRLLAVGMRWGGTEFNGRDDDLDPAPMGVAFTLAGAQERTAPAHYWVYGWK